MELLFVVLIAFAIGLGAHYLLPHRASTGSMLSASVAAAVSSLVWVALLWAGLTFDGGWIWVISLVVGGAVALALSIVLPRRRAASDAALFTRLAKA
ncbi:hypothetical protein [Galbitalea soli]|uniref:Uncharacterized protein n=1 Tax=Galbitalea soli TaxID=1268042 RepID=A0A7C9PLY6_9MICO|nr:hypothetical protein [Galbitalea soli]NEM90593.1 hypothetical protein [Galbitalea soli]NYJ31309.1 hypothetical protein [Galbitalea soli]